ncbi:MAG: YihY/virulence factor BrkB family protein [Deltaproteobacteria bacterium]|nr:YihY/virulence factor BrkB family protein [Deltaproteobacteria bacterium]
MHANPQRLQNQAPGPNLRLLEAPATTTLAPLMIRFLNLLWKSIWRAFMHDAFAIAKASAYSSILTFFPTLLVLGSVLATGKSTEVYSREISYALARVLPAGASTVQGYLRGTSPRSVGLLFTTSLLALWLASGVLVSWMEGFRRCYELPKIWGLVKERLIALSLVILAGIPLTFATVLIAFGSKIELTILSYLDRELGFYVLLMWTFLRWLIASLTSVAVIALIYHNAVPRTQPWHSVLPGATLATGMWFVVTMLFGWYLQNYADYSVIYGSLGVAIALLVWMYLVSLVILIGAEFNALLFPRSLLGRELTAVGSSR